MWDKKLKFVDPESSMVVTRGKRAGGKKDQIYGDER